MADPKPSLDLGALFGEFFGGTGSVSGDVYVALPITEREAASGARKSVAITRGVTCDSCAGIGSKTPGATRAPCSACAGSGLHKTMQGFFELEQACPACRGTRSTIADPCAACVGSGARQVASTVEVTVPPGVHDGQALRLPNAGSRLANGQAGHVYITVRITDLPAQAAIPQARIERLGGERPRVVPAFVSVIVVVAIACVLSLIFY